MSMLYRSYADIRDQIQTGDVIAYGGKGLLSGGIKGATNSPVSHVGIALRTEIISSAQEHAGKVLFTIESTSLDGFHGVVVSQLSLRIKQYDGDVWWLPLNAVSRAKLKIDVLADFLLRQDHKPYDYLQAVTSPLGFQQEDWSRWFCSELAVAGYETAGLFSCINSSIVTPRQLCQVNIFVDEYVQVKGKEKRIDDYNNISVDEWSRGIVNQCEDEM